jgi:ABC-type uncharacterized transport system permease subunit
MGVQGDPFVGVAALIVAVVLIVALFMVGRSVTLWYFRIDERVELLKEIRDSLRKRP